MIDTIREQLLPLADVPAYHQSRGLGRRVHKSAVYRWAIAGADGIRLETVKIGGMKVTSAEAIQRWVEARQVQDQPERVATRPQVHRPSHPTMGHEQAHRYLVERRVMPTELDEAIKKLPGFSEATLQHVGHALFRAGLRTPEDVRKMSAERLCKLPRIGPTSRPVVLRLKQHFDAT